jgi:hypothetical protein
VYVRARHTDHADDSCDDPASDDEAGACAVDASGGNAAEHDHTDHTSEPNLFTDSAATDHHVAVRSGDATLEHSAAAGSAEAHRGAPAQRAGSVGRTDPDEVARRRREGHR